MGRYNILKNMIETKKGDLIFIPKHSFENHHDHNHLMKKQYLQFFYETDGKMNKDKFKDWILKNKNMQKVTSEKVIQSLAEKEIVFDKYGDLSLSELGLRAVDELFRGEK